MNFLNLRKYLESQGYVMYLDSSRQDKAKEYSECRICQKPFNVVSFAKNGSYKHFVTCPECGGYVEI